MPTNRPTGEHTFLVEQFFIERDRTNPATIRADGEWNIPAGGGVGRGSVGCVYLELRGERGYFGMLSIDPSRQGMGVGHQLVNAVEKYFRDAGCKFSDLKIVNVRTELHTLYHRWGYVDTGTGDLRRSDAHENSRALHHDVEAAFMISRVTNRRPR